MKTVWKLIPVLTLVTIACASAVHRDAAPREAVVDEDDSAECSLSIAPHSSAEAVRSALQAVADGSLDPCAGAMAQREQYKASFLRIDQGERNDILVFRMQHRGDPLVVRP